MMKHLFEKHETAGCMVLIVVYVLTNSYCIQNFGTTNMLSAVINTCFTLLLITLMIRLQRVNYYGLTKIRDAKKYLYFAPLMVIASVNLWNGIHISSPMTEIIIHIITMINVGFIEEIIFRGFLFKLIEKEDGVKRGIVISSLTFGIGHIINLLNGAEFIPTLMQICYATAIGLVFVMTFYKSKTLWPCILTHICINTTSIFSVETRLSVYYAPIILVAVAIGYSIYLYRLDMNQ